MQNKGGPPSHIGNTSREAPSQNLGISLSSNSYVASPFSDANELAIEPIKGVKQKWEQGWEMGKYPDV